MTIGRPYNGFAEIDKDNLDLKDYDTSKRQRPLHIKENDGTFKDPRATLTEEQVKKETARCLGCGVAVIDNGKCLGCGVCTVMCKFDGVSLKRISNVGQKSYEDMPREILKNIPKREVSTVISSYMVEYFPVVTLDKPFFKDTKLEIEIIPGEAKCLDCGEVFNIVKTEGYCPKCNSFEKDVLSGREFLIKELVVYEDEDLTNSER